jgi:hypothetical protein
MVSRQVAVNNQVRKTGAKVSIYHQSISCTRVIGRTKKPINCLVKPYFFD